MQDGRGLQLTTFDFVTGCQETKLSFRQKVKPFSHFFIYYCYLIDIPLLSSILSFFFLLHDNKASLWQAPSNNFCHYISAETLSPLSITTGSMAHDVLNTMRALHLIQPSDQKIYLQPIAKVVETSYLNEKQLFTALSREIFPPSPPPSNVDS